MSRANRRNFVNRLRWQRFIRNTRVAWLDHSRIVADGSSTLRAGPSNCRRLLRVHESLVGTFRKCLDIRPESVMRTKSDVRSPLQFVVHTLARFEFAPRPRKHEHGLVV
jgi:hypothetical protein